MRQDDSVISALVIASLITTLVTTFLIGYRIYGVVRATSRGPKRGLNNVMSIILESAAIYVSTLLALAIVSVVPSFHDVHSPVLVASYYIELLAYISAVCALDYFSFFKGYIIDVRVTIREWLQHF